jgi:tetratricopeptide (TPR) repeat protein
VQKDTRGHLDALNQAVQRFPNDPSVFFRRAEYFMRDKATFRDAEQDLTRAIELAPDSAPFYQRRAQLRSAMENQSGAIEDLRKAVRAAPRDSDLVFSTLSQLARSGRDQDVAEVAADVAQQRTRDPSFLSALGAFFSQQPQNTLEAAERNTNLSRRYFQRAQEIDPTDFNTLNYLSALITGPKPDLLQADKILTDLGERGKKNPGYVMTQARIRMEQKRAPEAVRLAQESLRLIEPTNAALMLTWNADLARMLKDPKERVQVYESTARAGIHPDWVQYFRAEELIRDPARISEAAAASQQVAQVAKTPALKERAVLLHGSALFSMQQHEQAAKVWLDGVKEFPENSELLNNAAYILAENLNRAEEALPLAERAMQAAPNNADLLDTMGLILIRVGRVKEGLTKLEQGFSRMQSPQAGVACALHLAEGFLLDNNKEGAKRAIGAVDGLKERFANLLTPEQEARLQELRGKAQ